MSFTKKIFFDHQVVHTSESNLMCDCRSYGSGYGGAFGARGVGGRPFPFFFWPVVWGGGALLVAGTYLDARSEVSTTTPN